MDKLVEIVAKLRSPDGCPWDRKQTHETLIPYLLEEAWEVIDEIREGRDPEELKDELGDLLLQVVLHAQIASEDDRFTMQDVIETISEKMVVRHPHVFEENEKEYTEAELKERWHKQKTKEKDRKSVLDGISNTVPALMSSLKIGQRAASVGFDWKCAKDVVLKIEEELQEVKDEVDSEDREKLEEEIGDLLFSVANLARHFKINPEVALKKTNDKFKKRFSHVEKAINEAKESGKELTLDEMEKQWVAAK